jgi:hypothetical protein
MKLRIYLFASLSLFTISAFAQPAPSAAAAVVPPQVLFPVSTAPSNGDVNPYGVAFIPPQIPVNGSQGLTTVCNPGDILISNFNNAQNAQGTGNLQGLGTTITRIQSNGLTSTFFQTPASMTQMAGHPGQGFTNALVALQNGMVIVGSLPTTDGTFATVGPGSLLFIRRDGTLSNQISYQPTAGGQVLAQTTLGFVTSSFFANAPNAIDGPWSMAVNDQGNSIQLFISNVLAGTVVRFHIAFDSDGNGVNFDQPPVTIVSGLNHENDARLFLTGPSGLYYDPLPSSPTLDTLFIASSKDNAVYMLQGAGWNEGPSAPQLLVVDFTHLSGPLGVALAPNGNLYVANSDGNPTPGVGPQIPSAIVIYNMQGQYQGEFSVDPNAGGAFGVAFQTLGTVNRSARNGSIEITAPVARFGAVNDNQVLFNLWTLYFN